MAGTIASLPLAIQIDSNARPLSGCLLYLYNAGTSTPSIFYEDFATTISLSWPLVGDAAGRIPNFWVVDGTYRVRLTDSAGNEIFDINSITAIGASAVGAVGGSSVSTDQIFQTGDPLWLPVNTTRAGWIRGNALTIGSSSSGATERANADCQALFEYFWATFADSLCPVTGGRGGSAVADWGANKRIATLDMRGIGAYGLDTMGNSAAGRIAAATSAALLVGAEAYSVAQANLPNVNFTPSLTAASHSHTAGTLVAASHTHGAGTFAVDTTITNGANVGHATAIQTDVATSGTAARFTTLSLSTVSLANGAVTGATGLSGTVSVSGTSDVSGALTVSGTVASGGSGTALATLSPGRAGTWYFKL